MRRAGALPALVACAAWLTACAPTRREGVPGPAPDAGFAPYLAKGAEPFVADPDRGRTWLGVISHELPFDRAEVYCARLPPRPTGSWRVPEVGELMAAPFNRYQLPDPPVWLWSATPAPGDTSRRFAVNPYTGTLEPREARQGGHLRVLCVTEAGAE